MEANLCRFFFNYLFIYKIYLFCPWNSEYQEGECWDLIKWFNPGSGFLSCGWVYFMFNDEKGELHVCFVDICGNIDHHSLNFLFMLF